jgi:uncharacterized protein (DUF1015 family)
MVSEGVLVREDSPCYYAYRLTMGGHVQTGLVATSSVAAYDAGRIKKHEFTRPVKEDDRVRQIDTLNAQTGPVFLVYRTDATLDEHAAPRPARGRAEVDVTAARRRAPRALGHRRRCTGDALTAPSTPSCPALYVADGHHRSAAGSRVGNARRAANPAHTGDESYNHFLSVIFPHDQMQILDYNRVVRDLNGRSADAFLAVLGEAFDLELSDQPVKPAASGEFGMYLGRQWYRLRIHDERIPGEDPVARLDVSLLQDNLIGPLLGIATRAATSASISSAASAACRTAATRRQRRLGGRLRAVSHHHARPDVDVADAGEVMPPKSTWFEPKLADGLVSHVLD